MEAKQKIENRNFSKNKNEIENQNPRWNKRWFEQNHAVESHESC